MTNEEPNNAEHGRTSAAAEPADSSRVLGRTIKGRYRLKRLIAEGGMGAVYEGEHLEVGRRVAIKLVHAGHAHNPRVLGWLKQEARATGAIESENIVQVFDAGEDDELGLFIVMELLEGEDLQMRLEREGRLDPATAATIAEQVARGLSRAHARGIIHRDLKPANVFLCANDEGVTHVKLVDFGIAKLLRDAAAERVGPPSSGGIVGTPQYMSPEQAQGLDSVDQRTDVYSLGALLYEMVVGAPLVPDFSTHEQQLVHLVSVTSPRMKERIPTIDARLDRLVAEMTAHDPEARPRDMNVVRERLAALFVAHPRPSFPAIAVEAPAAAVTIDRPSAGRRSGAKRLGWSAATILASVLVVTGVRAVTSPATVHASQGGLVEGSRVPAVLERFPRELAIPGAEAGPRPVAVQASPTPARRAPALRASAAAPRPFGGTGIAQEF